MALQIRRGTDAERLLITPLQGELIYTTDSKKLYVGDGTTAGGIAVDTGTGGGGASLLDELTDVILTSPTNGQVLKYNGTSWINDTDLAGSSGGASLLDELNDVIITSPTNGQVLKYNGTSWINDTDLNTGISSVALNEITDVNLNNIQVNDHLVYNGVNWINRSLDIQDDLLPTLGGDLDLNGFSIIGNGDITINGTFDASNVNTDIISARSGNTVTIKHNTSNSTTYLNIQSIEEQSVLKLTRTSTSDIASGNFPYGVISFERKDINGTKLTGLIIGGDNYIYHTTETSGAFTESTFVTQSTVGGNTSFGIRTVSPTEALDVRGNGKFLGFVQFGSYTSVERDALTPAFGMVIYNTTTNTFQGYQNTGGTTPEWVNLS